jgi:hypothetical protein
MLMQLALIMMGVSPAHAMLDILEMVSLVQVVLRYIANNCVDFISFI